MKEKEHAGTVNDETSTGPYSITLSPAARAIRDAIREGRYRVDSNRLAMTMLHHRERPLKPNED